MVGEPASARVGDTDTLNAVLTITDYLLLRLSRLTRFSNSSNAPALSGGQSRAVNRKGLSV